MQIDRVQPRRLRIFEGGEIVVRDHVRVILGPLERLEPGGCKTMLLSSPRPRHLSVRDVPHEHVSEGVLGLAGDRSPARGADELATLELVERPLHPGPVAIAQRR
jgi:hypothetical protein